MSWAIEYFLDMITAERGASPHTIDAYRRDLSQFCEFSGISEKEVDAQDIEKFLQDLSKRGFSAKTIARKLSAIKEYFKFLYIEKRIRTNPAADVISPKQEKPLPKFLTQKEIFRLIEEVDSGDDFTSRRLSAMLKLMYACGLRVSELVSLPDNCINYEKKQIIIFGKGSKERIVPIADEAIKSVLEYSKYREDYLQKQKSSWMFPSKNAKSGHITRDAFFKNLKNLSVKAGISPAKVSPHVLRHSFATHLLNKKVDLRSVQKMLGHEDISTTEIYTHIVAQKLRDEVQKNHPLAEKK